MVTKQEIEDIVQEGNLYFNHFDWTAHTINLLFFSWPIKMGGLYIIGSKESVEFKTNYKQKWGEENQNHMKKRIFLEDVLFDGQTPGDGQRHYEITITSVTEEKERIRIEGKLEKSVNFPNEQQWLDNTGKMFSGYVRSISQ